MMHDRLHTIPARDPITGADLVISELQSEDGQVSIRGRFAIPRLAKLDPEQYRFLETFLRCRGMISSVERELGISYPTVRSRLDALLEALELAPPREERIKRDREAEEEKRRVLDQLERGEISPEEAKAKIKGAK